MEPIEIIAVLIVLAAAFAYVNHRLLKMPMTIGLMMISMVVSLLLIPLDGLGLPARDYAERLVASIDFHEVLMEGMLGLLLFAGALHVNLNDLWDQKLEVGIFATLGVAASTAMVGGALYLIGGWLGLPLDPIGCLLFGALISPTDPVAVMGILKRAKAPKSLETKIAGESLFNDGIGVVVFLVLLEISTEAAAVSAGHVLNLFIREVAGGALLGAGLGYLVYRMLRGVNQYQVEILLTLALVIGGYTLGHALHLSAPIAVVLAGLLIGNHGRRLAMGAETRHHLDTFWELIDEILNALLFVLIGLEVLVLVFEPTFLLAGALAVPVVLFSRFLSVGTPVLILRRWRLFVPRAVRIMTWGGLRGGISVALALSLPPTPYRELILTMTYVVVAFSILVQGLTIEALVAGRPS